MNMIKSISLVTPVIALFLLNLLTVCGSETNAADSVQTDLEIQLSKVESRLSDAKRGLGMGIDWLQYGDTILHIFTTEQNLVFILEIIDWLLRPIPNWDLPSSDIRQFLKDSEHMTDRAGVRWMILNLLLIKAPIESYSKPAFTEFLFDPMPDIRKRMIEVLTEDGTAEAIPALEKAKQHLKSEKLQNAPLEELALIDNAIGTIRLWDERTRTNSKPADDEIRELAERLLLLNKRDRYFGSPEPPSNMDGPSHIINRWKRFRWGAEYILNFPTKITLHDKDLLIRDVLINVQPEDWHDAFSMAMSYYNIFDQDIKRKGFIMTYVLDRVSAKDLHQLSYLLTSEDPTDVEAMGHLLRKYEKIGSEEHLDELKRALEFWREKSKIGDRNQFEKTIYAIEKRLGIIPAEEPESPIRNKVLNENLVFSL